VPDSSTHSAERGYRRHRGKRVRRRGKTLRRYFRVLVAALVVTALLWLTLYLLSKPRSLSPSGPELPDDSAVQFK
jgi:peptidoglycan/LPS O-acetylase OafA/YrhL